MKLQGLSVKRLFFYVIIGLILSMTMVAAILYFITEQVAVLVVGAVLILCALAWLLALTQILGKKLALFTSDLCGTLDHMIAGNKASLFPRTVRHSLPELVTGWQGYIRSCRRIVAGWKKIGRNCSLLYRIFPIR